MNTNNPAKVGTYNVKMEIYLENILKGTSNVFIVTVVDICQTTDVIETPVIQDIVYFVSDPELEVTIPPFVDSSGICGNFNYNL